MSSHLQSCISTPLNTTIILTFKGLLLFLSPVQGDHRIKRIMKTKAGYWLLPGLFWGSFFGGGVGYVLGEGGGRHLFS